MIPAYAPDAGDLVWLTFDPQAGREQAGRRPAFIVSPRIYNSRTGLALVCPITNQAKGYPFEVEETPDGVIIRVSRLRKAVSRNGNFVFDGVPA